MKNWADRLESRRKKGRGGILLTLHIVKDIMFQKKERHEKENQGRDVMAGGNFFESDACIKNVRPLEEAVRLAYIYHEGQKDKNGEEYIHHPLRVLTALSDRPIHERIVGVLHDILEDTECTKEILIENGIPMQAIKDIQILTRQDGETYFAYIERIKESKSATIVKIADLQDNLRDGCPDTLRKRYQKALRILQGDSVE